MWQEYMRGATTSHRIGCPMPNAPEIHRKSGYLAAFSRDVGNKPLSPGNSRPTRNETCFVDCSELPSAPNKPQGKQPPSDLSSRPKWRDLLFLSTINRSQGKQPPSDLFIPTEVEGPAFSLHYQSISRKAATLRFVIPTEVEGPAFSLHYQSIPRKAATLRFVIPTVVEGPAFLSAINRSQGKQSLSDLSSRSQEGPAVPSNPITNAKVETHTPLCHPERSEAKPRDLQLPSISNQSQPKPPPKTCHPLRPSFFSESRWNLVN
jgi:hypothetical protein